MKQFKTKASTFHVDEHGIIHKAIIEGVNYTTECAKEDQEMLLKLSKGKKALVMVNSEAFYTMTPEGLNDLAVFIGQSRRATAVISSSLGIRIFVDTLNGITRKVPPFRMFETEKEGVKWLLSFKKRRMHNPAIGPKHSHKFNTAACEVRLDKNGILIKKIYEGAHINLAIAKKAEAQASKLVGKEKVLALLDRSASYTITPQAVKYLQKNVGSGHRIATALVLSKPGHVQPSTSENNKSKKTPVKVFTNKTTAVKWLLAQKKQGNNSRKTTWKRPFKQPRTCT